MTPLGRGTHPRMDAPSDRIERLRREAEFHDEWAAGVDPSATPVDETFTGPTAAENGHILEQFGSVEGKRVLDYGCGAAEGGIYLAKLGAKVVGVDVSAGSLELAQRLARHHGVEIETRQVTGPQIPAETGEFDLIYGNGVLHHVDLRDAKPELARILKPSGKGCFIEPLSYNPVIEVYRHIAHTVRTPDEHPLSFRDIEGFSSHFRDVSHREFWLTTLAVFLRFYLWEGVDPTKERYWKKIYTDASRLESFYSPLRRLDDVILARAPFLGRLCWNTVITVTSPITTT
jgi:SAM-dependent methyltransferase